MVARIGKIVLPAPENFQQDTQNVNCKAQSEKELENELIKKLESQGYEYVPNISGEKGLKDNLRKQLEILNRKKHLPGFRFTDEEWESFYLENFSGAKNQGIIRKSEIIHDENGAVDFARGGSDSDNVSIYLIDKTNLENNSVQVMHQFSHTHKDQNQRYDVTILVNGLPMVHIELKRRGTPIQNAFCQAENYKRNMPRLFEFVQIFVISNGTYTKYYSNTTAQNKNKNSFLFTSYWGYENNRQIWDLEEFAETFFQKIVLLEIICKYCVFEKNKNLKVLRPYQIAAVERILCKIHKVIKDPEIYKDPNNKDHSLKPGGYVWHTTGSGKTLTSFVASKLASKIAEVDEVLFVVDRIELDQQTQKEYQNFMGDYDDALQNAKSTTDLIKKLTQSSKSAETPITTLTIQKLHNLMKCASSEEKALFKDKRIVIIMDECHRSQTDTVHREISSVFPKRILFGFTGTPLLPRFPNPQELEIERRYDKCEEVFGERLHQYQIVHAITDENVLSFRIEYTEFEDLPEKLYDRSRRNTIASYILEHFHRLSNKGRFNSIFFVQSVGDAVEYYSFFKDLQKHKKENERIKVVMVFCPSGTPDEKNPSQFHKHDRDLEEAIKDYNELFECNLRDFGDYRKHVSAKVKNKEIDVLLVVDMFLTGFDAPCINTVWVDKNLKEHKLIQAFSRANRIFNENKPHANIVCFREDKETEEQIKQAFTLFALGNEHLQERDLDTVVKLPSSFVERFKKYQACEDVMLKKFPSPTDPTTLATREQKEEYVTSFDNWDRAKKSVMYDKEFEGKNQIGELAYQNYLSRYYQEMDFLKKESEELKRQGQIVPETVNFYNLKPKRWLDIDVACINRWLDELKDQLLDITIDKLKKKIEEIKNSTDSHSYFWKEKEILYDYFDRLLKREQIGYQEHKKQKFMQKVDEIILDLNLNRKKAIELVEEFLDSGIIDFEGKPFNEITGLHIVVDSEKIDLVWSKFEREIRDLFDRFNMLPEQEDE